MQPAHDKNVQKQFGPRATAYVESAVHSQGEDLDALEIIVAKAAPHHAIDLGCGGGHVAYTMARHARQVTATDLSGDMLAAVTTTARSRGLENIETVEASALNLPFNDSTFDFLGCRYSAHHWFDVEQGLREARRVLKKGAPAIFIDVYSPGRPLLDTHLQAIELLRDTSHVRNYSAAEWTDMLAHAGFTIEATRTRQVRMHFDTWITRMATKPVYVAAIRALQDAAPGEVREHFGIEADGSFMLDMLMVEAIAA
ncbi:methyltransferase domain-containing protein [Rhizobium sp. KVB221]|uniref:Methyltransferase domain-containing protein n=1 Tax=Rhizobium setariae TaxID=2801340 RepID=A0A936YRE4_9HYPH|nr:methyltransferase domain-containing protein [Rhizobium setariae]MBL0373196.1 methyltransferase domain-containing protein [Rhizobium setariae]